MEDMQQEFGIETQPIGFWERGVSSNTELGGMNQQPLEIVVQKEK